MPITVKYTSFRVPVVAAINAAGELGVEAGAKVLLNASLPHVPVDSGTLKASGKADTIGPHAVAVSYERTSPEGYDVAARVHEDNTMQHPNGGESHFLSGPAESEGHAIAEGIAEAVRVIL